MQYCWCRRMSMEFHLCESRPPNRSQIQFVCRPSYLRTVLSSCLFANIPGLIRNRNLNLSGRRSHQMETNLAQQESKAIERFSNRDWKPGDVYAPHDLSAAEMLKWMSARPPTQDVFDAVDKNPLHLYTVCSPPIYNIGPHRLMSSKRILQSCRNS